MLFSEIFDLNYGDCGCGESVEGLVVEDMENVGGWWIRVNGVDYCSIDNDEGGGFVVRMDNGVCEDNLDCNYKDIVEMGYIRDGKFVEMGKKI